MRTVCGSSNEILIAVLALFYCERLFEIEKNQDYLYTIGWILMSQKKYFQAISAFERYTGKESSYGFLACSVIAILNNKRVH